MALHLSYGWGSLIGVFELLVKKLILNFVDVLLKSLFDHIVAFLGLLFLSPILLVTALLIRVRMPGGPVIFKQKRVGRYGRLFTMYKFRSMTVGHSGSSVSVKGESRITPLGAKVEENYKD